MSATPSREKDKARRSYTKPAVKRVHLRPEEAVLGACKVSGSVGPAAANCGVIPCTTLVS